MSTGISVHAVGPGMGTSVRSACRSLVSPMVVRNDGGAVVVPRIGGGTIPCGYGRIIGYQSVALLLARWIGIVVLVVWGRSLDVSTIWERMTVGVGRMRIRMVRVVALYRGVGGNSLCRGVCRRGRGVAVWLCQSRSGAVLVRGWNMVARQLAGMGVVLIHNYVAEGGDRR